MANPDAIKYELGLTIVGLIVFWIWQTVTLRRDMRKTAMEEAHAEPEAQDPPARHIPSDLSPDVEY